MSKKMVSYGLRELSIASLVKDEEPKATYAELQRLWGAKTASASLTFDENSLTGDDGTVETDSSISQVEVSFENGIMTFESLKILTGGAVVDLMGDEDPEKVVGKRFSLDGGQSLPYFGLMGKTEKEGTLKFILPKVKLNSLEFSFAEQDYCIVSGSGIGVKRMSDEKMYFMDKMEESNQPLVVEDLEYKSSTETEED